jgi:hypothetical protein
MALGYEDATRETAVPKEVIADFDARKHFSFPPAIRSEIMDESTRSHGSSAASSSTIYQPIL